MKLVVIFNPKSGKKKVNTEYEIVEYLKKKEYEFELYYTNVKFDFTSIKQAINEDVDAIVVSGGDGTVSKLIEYLYINSIKIPVLIIPSGSANELAYSLSLPTSSKECIDLLEELNTIKIDLGCVNDSKYFTYSLSFGNFTHLSYTTPQPFKKRLGYFGYWLYGAVSFYLLRLKKYKVKLAVNGKEYNNVYINGGITNSFSLGGIIQYDRNDVDLDDGLFEIYMMRIPRNVSGFLKIIRSIITHRYDDEYFDMEKSNEFMLTMEKEHSFNSDGEYLGKYRKIKVKVIPSAVNVIIK